MWHVFHLALCVRRACRFVSPGLPPPAANINSNQTGCRCCGPGLRLAYVSPLLLQGLAAVSGMCQHVSLFFMQGVHNGPA